MKKRMTIFCSWVEEYGMNPKYFDYSFGRIEIYPNIEGVTWDTKEVRFCSNKTKLYTRIRDIFDFKNLSISSYKRMLKIVRKYLQEYPDLQRSIIKNEK